jgi:lipopolysaccharide biosynthesis protein
LPNLAALIHIHYEDSLDNLKEYFLNFEKLNAILFFNISKSSKSENFISKIKKTFPDSFIIETPNIGKDIGGKLALLDLCLRLNIKAEYYILLHDKMSPHTTLGDIWRKKLLRIIEPENIEKIKNMFEQDNKLGIVGANEFIMNEYDAATGNFNCTNNLILKELIQQYKFNLKSFNFVGGTMFWVRAEIFNNFFFKYPPLKIRSTLEKGNVLDHDHGTNTHTWERILNWIAIDQGYEIKGFR